MTTPKICISVKAETIGELCERFRLAEERADVIEVRLDGLKFNEIHEAFQHLSSSKPVLLTYRPDNQGGDGDRDPRSRISVWTMFAMNKDIDHTKFWVDLETDLLDSHVFLIWTDQCHIVRSYHDMAGVPRDLEKRFSSVMSMSNVGKLATSAQDVTDAIGLWKLLDAAVEKNKPFIPIAMGEAGKWTRILGHVYGGYMTYASLDDGSSTATGQISIDDLENTFRINKINSDTGVYGILAGDTTYSVSPWMQNAAFSATDSNAVFLPLQTKDIANFIARMVRPETREIDLNFKGFSVTNPHKQTIIEHLDKIDETAKQIGAVNTVKITDEGLIGYNTDAIGFIRPMKDAIEDLNGLRVAVFGAGGAARACVYALIQEGAIVTIIARNEEKGAELAAEFDIEYRRSSGDGPVSNDFDVVVNATPLGTRGSREKFTILTAARLEGLKLVYDLVYNPPETYLIREAKAARIPNLNGIDMLVAQGREQFRIWTDLEPPEQQMRAAVLAKLASWKN